MCTMVLFLNKPGSRQSHKLPQFRMLTKGEGRKRDTSYSYFQTSESGVGIVTWPQCLLIPILGNIAKCKHLSAILGYQSYFYVFWRGLGAGSAREIAHDHGCVLTNTFLYPTSLGLFFKICFLLSLIMCRYVCLYVDVCTGVSAGTQGGQRHWIPWSWSLTFVLGIEPGSFAKAPSALTTEPSFQFFNFSCWM